MFVYNILLIGFAVSPAVCFEVRNLASISTCRGNEFTCSDGTCIRAGAVCDTYWDCPDGSDEASCYSSTDSNLTEATVSLMRYKRQTPCGLHQWKCRDGTCIAIDGKCDGKIDCPDRSDETHARCRNINRPAVSAKCVLPPYPEHGTYVVINAPYGTPDQSFEYALLNIICEQGYGVVHDTVPFCVDGIWRIPIQKCVPFCTLDPDVSVHYYCQDPGTDEYRICNQSLPSGTLVKAECNAPSYGSRDPLLSMTCQNDGKWNRIIKCKPAFCTLDPDISVNYYCQDPETDDYRICNQALPSGTLVKAECNAPIYGSRDALLSMTCQRDGKWNRIIKCTPECGRIVPDAEGLIFGGTDTDRGKLPWHVVIYEKPTVKRNEYRQICGGSLVSNSIVISGAHCFWDERKHNKQSASNYAVATAKLFRKWDHKDDKDAQKSELRSIEIPPRYSGSERNFENDIAVLILETPFVYSINVRPVCLDLFDPNFDYLQRKVGNLGKVAHWDSTEENWPASAVLKVLEIPNVPIIECIISASEFFRAYITADKMCAGNDGTAAVCKGDSGGGLSYPEIERGITRYYLRGVTSTRPFKTPQHSTCTAGVIPFTEIYFHKDFINQFIGQFRCKDGSAISASELCDGNPNCSDGSDEEISACADMICPSNLFQCAYGACVDQDSVCNGINECADGSDESDELCNRQLPSNPIATNSSLQCVLPPHPEHGTYEVANAPYATPGLELPSLSLNVTCRPGYGVVGTSTVFCLNGTWFNSIPKCIRFCKLDKSPSVHFHCLVPGSNYGRRACNAYEPSGTVVSPECNSPNYYSPFTLPYMRCIGGSWDNVAVCSPECGRVTPYAEGLIYGGTEAVRGELAWHVAIYQKPTKGKNFKQICGGSLVSNRIVISAAHCFWNYSKDKKHAASNYAVASAKLFREWDHKDDKKAQKSELRSIEIPPRYLGVRANYQYDIAVLILETPVVYYTYVRPVCLDLFDRKFNDLQLYAGNFGKVAGWGLTAENGPASPVLKTAQLPFVPYQECIRITPETFTESITGDKICAGYSNGTAAVCKGDSGGGLAFPEIERGITHYYLRGIASTAPKNATQKCNVLTVTTFTELYHHKDYINEFIGQFRCKDGSSIPALDLCDGNPDCPDGSDEEISACAAKKCPSYLFRCADGTCVDQGSDCKVINECADGSDESDELCNRQLPSNRTATNRPIQSSNCILPPYPEHGTYVVANAANATPGQGFPSVSLNVTCQPGYGVVGNGIVFCLDGTWYNSIPKCIRFCKLDNRPFVQFHCLVSGSNEVHRACNAYEPSGTVVRPECKNPNYYSAFTLPVMRCIDGRWNYVAICSPECGRATSAGVDLRIDGRLANPREVPWHVSIYQKTTEPYLQICGGTLVSNQVVISAAHCFWNDVSKQQPASMYAVAIGKIHRPWNNDRDEDAQKSDVKEIKIPGDFQGTAANFKDDIAVLILETAFVYNTFVRPICLDFDVNFDRRQLQPGKLGRVAAWQASQILKVVELPYVDINQCSTTLPLASREYITSDKICAGYVNGTALCKGDSGGGLTFPETERGTEHYFLRGIVSTAANNENLCNSYTLTTFTQISKHEDFIKEVL